MSGFDLYVEVKAKFKNDAICFLKFLQNIAKTHDVRLKYKSTGTSKFYLTIDATPGAKIDSFFQELILNRGLYYYSNTIKSRHKIISEVIKPIIENLLESTFEITHSKLLRRHILGKITNPFIPGDFYSTAAHEYEMLFRRWDSNLISDFDFIRDLDDLLAKFMLEALNHPKGQKSPNFGVIVSRASKANIIWDKDLAKNFNAIHSLRTKGLHRLERDVNKDDVSYLAMRIYWFFQYHDEFQESQKFKTIKHNGKNYRRLRYGYEKWVDENGNPYLDESGKPYNYKERAQSRPCHDCAALYGQYHCFGCDMEQCPVCKGQAFGCGCGLDEEDYL